MKTIAIIPARKGSKRLPGKNMALLAGKPLLQYAIESTRRGPGWPKSFDTVVVSSDWDECLDLARTMGVEALRRPPELCGDRSHDAEFVRHALEAYPGHELFAIVRPTNPFRTVHTIDRALYRFRWELAIEQPHSMRAVEPTKHHPCKTWIVTEESMEPHTYFTDKTCPDVEGYDLPTQALPPCFAQNAALHIGKTSNLTEFGNVSGYKIAPFYTIGYEGLDINDRDDLEFAEWLLATGRVENSLH